MKAFNCLPSLPLGKPMMQGSPQRTTTVEPRPISPYWDMLWQKKLRQNIREGAFEKYPPEVADALTGSILSLGTPTPAVIDVGAGADMYMARRISSLLPFSRVFALDCVDPDPASTSSSRVSYIKADALNIPDFLRRSSFDALTCSFTLDYFSNSEKDLFLGFVPEMLRPGGVAVFVLHHMFGRLAGSMSRDIPENEQRIAKDAEDAGTATDIFGSMPKEDIFLDLGSVSRYFGGLRGLELLSSKLVKARVPSGIISPFAYKVVLKRPLGFPADPDRIWIDALRTFTFRFGSCLLNTLDNLRRGESFTHSRTRYFLAHLIARDLVASAENVQGIYLFGSTAGCDEMVGFASDIDLIVEVAGAKDKRSVLERLRFTDSGLTGLFNGALAGRGHKGIRNLIDFQDKVCTSDEVKKRKGPFAAMVNSIDNPPTRLFSFNAGFASMF